MECFNQKQKTIIHKFWIQGSAALIQSPPHTLFIGHDTASEGEGSELFHQLQGGKG